MHFPFTSVSCCEENNMVLGLLVEGDACIRPTNVLPHLFPGAVPQFCRSERNTLVEEVYIQSIYIFYFISSCVGRRRRLYPTSEYLTYFSVTHFFSGERKHVGIIRTKRKPHVFSHFLPSLSTDRRHSSQWGSHITSQQQDSQRSQPHTFSPYVS